MTAEQQSGPHTERNAFVGMGVLVTLVYLMTAARDPIFGDGLELVAAAAVGGVPHPPGYPLLTMLLAPIASGAGAYFRATLVCAAFVLGAAILLARAWRALAPSPTASSDRQLWEPFFPAALLGLFAFSTTAWAAATVVEVYALNALLLAGIIAALVPKPEQGRPGLRVAIASVLLGLAMCNHLSALCMAPLIFLRWVQILALKPTKQERAFAFAAPLLFVVALTPWLYIPIRSATLPPINWGGGHTWEGFVWLVRGGDYGRTQLLQLTPGVPFTVETWLGFAWQRTLLLLSVLGGEALGAETRLPRFLLVLLGLGVLALTIAGFIRLARSQRLLAAGLAIAITLQVAFVYIYNIPDIEDYFLGIWATAFVPLAMGVYTLVQLASDRFGYSETIEKQKRVVIALGLLILIMVGSNWRVADMSNEDLVPLWTNALLDALPENAVMLTHGDYDGYPLWYALHAEGRRPDVFLINANFMRYDWYSFMIPQNDPLDRTAIPEPGDVIADRITIFDHVEMLRRAAIDPNIDKAPVFHTGDLYYPGPGHPPTISSILSRHYNIERVAALLTEEQLLHMFENYPVPAPPILERISPR